MGETRGFWNFLSTSLWRVVPGFGVDVGLFFNFLCRRGRRLCRVRLRRTQAAKPPKLGHPLGEKNLEKICSMKIF